MVKTVVLAASCGLGAPMSLRWTMQADGKDSSQGKGFKLRVNVQAAAGLRKASDSPYATPASASTITPRAISACLGWNRGVCVIFAPRMRDDRGDGVFVMGLRTNHGTR